MRKTFQAMLGIVVCLPFAWCEGEPAPLKEAEKELVNTIGMKFRLIQPGSFMMGSDKGEDDEKPVHKVTLTKGFCIGVYEVTQEEWEKLMGSNPSRFKGPKNPVDTVSWDDAQEFIRKLSEKEKVTYRLPTEAEWEYACRAGTTTEYYWGDGFDGRYAWNDINSGGKTQPVGTRRSNAWGLYDMSGNVWEWCEDWYSEQYPADKEAVDPKGAAGGSHGVYRGGSWHYTAIHCRSALRNWYSPSIRFSDLGFRLVRTMTNTGPQARRRPVVAPDAGPAVSPPTATLPGAQTEELVNTIGMKFRLIQPGSFMMGSDKGEDDEKPVHKVTLTKGFDMGVYEVTQEEWEKVMGSNPSDFKGPKNPVDTVSWEDAQEFIRKLSEKEKVTYRLPTEAEWEYACRAGTTTRFYWGDDADDREIGDYAWYYGNLVRTKIGTKPAGQKKPNAWGLYDMSGNVYEWCQDWYADKYPLERQIDPTGPKSGSDRVARGGCWDGSASYCRSADRGRLSPSDRGSRVGFRLVRTMTNTGPQARRRPVVAPDVGPAVSPPTATLPGAQGEELVNSIGMKFRLIQPGSFMMGSDKGEDNEKPVHKVTLTKGFYIGVYEVTQEEWGKVMGSNPSLFKGPKNPVENVSWDDAQEFARKLSQKENVTYRLPTEAEWEYACR
ncbi:MAG: formylglycine-generating enzyme family protein, partial [bacterium]|nr:formylglycine-generating enzyme family protein [bacterium]